MERAVGPGHALDCANVGTVGLNREGEAGPPGLAVDDYRAAAADTVLAPTWVPVRRSSWRMKSLSNMRG